MFQYVTSLESPLEHALAQNQLEISKLFFKRLVDHTEDRDAEYYYRWLEFAKNSSSSRMLELAVYEILSIKGEEYLRQMMKMSHFFQKTVEFLNLDMINLVVKYYATDQEDVDYLNNSCMIHRAVQIGHAALVEKNAFGEKACFKACPIITRPLFQIGANLDKLNFYKQSPLYLAAENNFESIGELLLTKYF